MTFTRANPFSWFPIDTLTSAQANQIDSNISNSVDVRDGYSNTIYSNISFDNGTTTTFSNNAEIVIDDPSKITIRNGALSLDCQITGYTLPLRCGLAYEAISGTSHTISSASLAKGIIVFTGALTSDVQVLFPASTYKDYYKLIDNRCTSSSDYKISITTSDYLTTGVYIPNGKSGIVWIDGYGSSAIKEPSNNVDSIFFKSDLNAYGILVQAISVTSPIVITDYGVEFDAKAGDMFEISYTAGMYSSNAAGHIYMQVYCSDNPGTQYESITKVTGTTEIVQSINFMYTLTTDQSNFIVELRSHISGFPGTVASPFSFTVKRIIP